MSIVAIVGDADSGKTVLAEQLTSVLRRRGLRVAYVKHAPHGFEPGRAGSDSERVRAAGADPVLVIGPDGLVQLVSDRPDLLLEQALTGLRGDVVLLEGFSASSWPKLRVSTEGMSPREVAPPLIADLVRRGPRFELADIEAVLDRLLDNPKARAAARVCLFADDRQVQVRGFAALVLGGTVRGLVETLRGVGPSQRIRVEVDPSA